MVFYIYQTDTFESKLKTANNNNTNRLSVLEFK